MLSYGSMIQQTNSITRLRLNQFHDAIRDQTNQNTAKLSTFNLIKLNPNMTKRNSH